MHEAMCESCNSMTASVIKRRFAMY